MDTLDRIKLLIRLNQKNYSTVANECGLNNSSFSEWNKGKSRPSVEAIVKLASYFGVSTDYLLGVTDEKTRPNEKSELYERLDADKERLLDTYERLSNRSQDKLLGYAQCLLDND